MFRIKFATRKFLYRLKERYRKLTRGFSNKEVWNLNNNIIENTLPKLKYFREHFNSYPCDMTKDQWDSILTEIIVGFQIYKDKEIDCKYDIQNNILTKDEIKIVQNSCELFGKYLLNFWD